nr:MAG TPA: hypothetical protein [Caudoviricetes sp.]
MVKKLFITILYVYKIAFKHFFTNEVNVYENQIWSFDFKKLEFFL